MPAVGAPDHKDYADPTINVKEQLAAAVLHITDLRKSEDARLRSEFTAESKRVDESIAAERRRVDEQMKLRAEHAVELRDAESKRIDAIRAVDINAVSVASERAGAAAAVLANQVAASAETLRSLVASTAAAFAQQLALQQTQFNDRLNTLEKSQYTNKGASGGMRDVGGWVFAGIMALFTIASIVWAILK